MALLRSVEDIHPDLAFFVVTGLPKTIFYLGTPEAIISFIDVWGAHPPETLNSP